MNRSIAVTISFFAMVLLLPVCAVSTAGAQGFDDGLYTISVIFYPDEITGEPYVDENQDLVIPTSSGSKVLPTISNCRQLAAAFPASDSLYRTHGPWVLELESELEPLQLVADIQALPEVYMAKFEDYHHPDYESPLLGETAKTWFPQESSALFCEHQEYLNSPRTDELPAPTLLDVGQDPCLLQHPQGNISRDMDMPQAWGITRGSDEIVVAVIDTGVDWVHPDLGGAGVDPASSTLEEILLSYNDGNIFRNQREEIGDANEDGKSGVDGFDDDGDGDIDEDPNGFFPGNLPELDVAEGFWTAIDTFTLTDANANWTPGALVGSTVWTDVTNFPQRCDTIVDNTATTISVTRIPNQQIGMCAVAANAVAAGYPGWIGLTEPGFAYFVGNGDDDDLDGVVDDFGYNPNDDDENGYADDLRGWGFREYTLNSGAVFKGTPDARPGNGGNDHGTLVASVLGAVADDDGSGIVGVSPSVKILPLKTVGVHGGYSAHNASAVRYCRELKYADGSRVVDIIVFAQVDNTSCSVMTAIDGNGDYVNILTEQLAAAIDEGILIVNGAGNSNEFKEEATYINCIQDVIPVGGVRGNDRHWFDPEEPIDGSVWGPWVKISARSAGIITDSPCGPGSNCCGPPATIGGYKCYQQGTSLASPLVGGTLALMLTANPNLTSDEARAKLLSSVDPLDLAEHVPQFGLMGSGRVNAYKALTVWGTVPAAQADTTWAGDVYVSGDIVVPPGKTLTIDPGTTVHVAQDDIADLDGNPTQISFEIAGSIDWDGSMGAIDFECFSDSPDSLWGPLVIVPTGGGQSILVSDTEFGDLELDQVEFPNGGESIAVGENVAITWSTEFLESWHQAPYEIADRLDLYYSNDGGVANWALLASDLDPTSGEYAWTPQAGDVSSEGRVRIVLRHSLGVTLGEDLSNANFLVTDEAAYYANRSSDTGYDYTAKPYASLAADLDGDGDQDLFVTDKAEFEPAGWMEHEDNIEHPELPLLSDRAGQAIYFPSGHEPQGLRGVAAADMDNDGDIDFFAAAEGEAGSTPRLYLRNATAPHYTDIGPGIGAGGGDDLETLASKSWTGAWGDYDRDGRIDLFIGRADEVATNFFDPEPDILLHNDGGGAFSDVSDLGINGDGSWPLATLTASWADYDADGNLDLILGDDRTFQEQRWDIGSGASYNVGTIRVYQNDVGGPGYLQAFVDVTESLFENAVSLRHSRALHWADADNDGLLDIVVGSRSSSSRVQVYWNDGAGGFSTQSTLDPGKDVHAMVVLDQDFDGAQDLLLTEHGSAAETTSAILLRNDPQSPGSTFADHSAQTGITLSSLGPISAISPADFGGSAGAGSDEDGDFDLFLGDDPANQAFFYQAKSTAGADSPANKWLRVRLGPDPSDPYEQPSYGFGNNALGIGATVTVQLPASGPPTWQQTQVVDGGSGLGGQRGSVLTFGVGQTSDDALITVAWPDGYTQTRTVLNSNLNAEELFTDDHLPEIVVSSMAWGQIPQPGGLTDWEFRWQTEYSTDPSLDAVYVTQEPGHRNCDLPDSEHPDEITLNAANPDVEITVTVQVNGRYQHKLLWKNRVCDAPCGYRWNAKSGVTSDRAQTTALQSLSLTFCMP